jgi:hypothetical protein
MRFNLADEEGVVKVNKKSTSGSFVVDVSSNFTEYNLRDVKNVQEPQILQTSPISISQVPSTSSIIPRLNDSESFIYNNYLPSNQSNITSRSIFDLPQNNGDSPVSNTPSAYRGAPIFDIPPSNEQNTTSISLATRTDRIGHDTNSTRLMLRPVVLSAEDFKSMYHVLNL